MRNIIFEQMIAKACDSSTKWLPLWMHMQDTAGMMRYLVNEHVSDSFAETCNMDFDLLIKTSVFLAYIHDIGKATVSFQYKISRKISNRRIALEHYGLSFPDYYEADKIIKTPHALAGEEILRYLGCPGGLAAVIGAHHGLPTEYAEVRNQDLCQPFREIEFSENYYGKKEENINTLKNAWSEIYLSGLAAAGFESSDQLPVIGRSAQMLLTGLLIMADWISSNTDYFPLISIDDEGASQYEYPSRVDVAWERISLTERWNSGHNNITNMYFKNSFGFMPSSVQRTIFDIVEQSEKPGLFILEAPMGCGKTEAALGSAELLAAKSGKSGLFFGMPTQATANAIFPRILNWAESQSEDFFHTVQLKHGSAELNECFQNIQKGIPTEDYSDSGLIVHNWFCDSKKACLADFVTATVDQMLMMALKRKHVMLLHLGLAEKVVIIDEVHAYDSYMNQYLEMALQWLGTYNTPVILLSATLPSNRRMSLIRAFLGIKTSNAVFENETGYPLLTWTDGNEIRQHKLPYDGNHQSVTIHQITGNDVISRVEQAVAQGGCVGVIVNTVKRAQTFAEEIRRINSAEVILYHAQYLYPDRAKKERLILERIGKNSTYDRRKGLVVIGTQVLEQSLDIDFDLLITDICPMDLLLQRIGRIHRHKRIDRPDSLTKPVCIVITDEISNESTSSCEIYSEWLLRQTIEKLPHFIVLPDDIPLLVQDVYRASDDSKQYQEYKNNQEIKAQRAQNFRIAKPKGTDIHGLLSHEVNDSAAEASVRDGISSIEVLVMQRCSNGSIYYIAEEERNISVTSVSDDEICRKIAEQRFRLPSVFCQKWNIDRVIKEIEDQCRPYVATWQSSHWLKGQLVLFLDEGLDGCLAGYRLHYSYDNGLQYEKEEDDDEGNRIQSS